MKLNARELLSFRFTFFQNCHKVLSKVLDDRNCVDWFLMLIKCILRCVDKGKNTFIMDLAFVKSAKTVNKCILRCVDKEKNTFTMDLAFVKSAKTVNKCILRCVDKGKTHLPCTWHLSKALKQSTNVF
jgi:hypothetical protein